MLLLEAQVAELVSFQRVHESIQVADANAAMERAPVEEAPSAAMAMETQTDGAA